MTSSQLITCKINGVEVEAWVKNRSTVAQFLREQLGLTGTKVSCEIQVCGSCTVLVDGSPISSCSVFAYRLQGKSVTTIEGVAERGHLNDVQEAFVNNFAFQCGFCTSGFIMMTMSLLGSSERPTDEEISEHLDGNLCRCTGYEPILAAAKVAVRKRFGDE
jgi:aerobic-type carbon monoxide dehydrogenase small subunit (CoxS/CutS family)